MNLGHVEREKPPTACSWRGIPTRLALTRESLENTPGPSWGIGPRGTAMGCPGNTTSGGFAINPLNMPRDRRDPVTLWRYLALVPFPKAQKSLLPAVFGCPSSAMTSVVAARIFTRRKLCLRLMNRPNPFWLIGFHVSARRNALSRFNMPAMSPTMTEGGIASWKKREGDTFATGDVLLEIV